MARLDSDAVKSVQIIQIISGIGSKTTFSEECQ